MMYNEYVAITYFHDFLIALTKDGKLYQIFWDDLQNKIGVIRLIDQLPEK